MPDTKTRPAVRLAKADEFDPEKTFECGQCFRWSRTADGVYTGVAFGRAASVWAEGETVFTDAGEDEVRALWSDYFDLKTDYKAINKEFTHSDFLRTCAEYGRGIRILNQDFWETLCSFIISQCNNIPRIKKIILTLCENFGEPVLKNGETLYTFPAAETVARLGPDDLEVLKCGYRAEYISKAARFCSNSAGDTAALRNKDAREAVRELMKLRGVGEKVANCVALFGLGKKDAFPVDVWMRRALEEFFPPGFDPLSLGPYAGLAQQYIYHYARTAARTKVNGKGEARE
ncbi:MAG: DNA-3-methyladenine glycosylase 2 family protein [Oscillospiraceae bacterium]|nr:DNA-3-methyladenine glycosylase 2 family protein [Oscillospiraceae bacterium]